jgi:hypothetical protein
MKQRTYIHIKNRMDNRSSYAYHISNFPPRPEINQNQDGTYILHEVASGVCLHSHGIFLPGVL